MDGDGRPLPSRPVGEGSRSAETSTQRRSVVRTFAARAAAVFGLCGFAFAYPIFDLLGNNGTFLVVHDTTGWKLVLFALVVLLVPPLVVMAGLLLLHLVWPAADRVTTAVVLGCLFALFLVPAIDRSADLGVVLYLLFFVVAAAGAGWCYLRFGAIRTLARYLAPAPLLFAGVFLFISPVNALLTPDDPAALAEFGGARTPVVVLIFDELPLGVLVDENGALDTARYPGFAELAADATWYPNATTVSTATYLAVPAIQTGRIPQPGSIPIAAENPHSLFTMLGNTHEMRVVERTTRNCPASLCEQLETEETKASLLKDSLYAFLHTLLPTEVENDWLPEIGNSWAGFGEDRVEDAAALARADGVDRKQWQEELGNRRPGIDDSQAAFLQSIRPGDRPGFWYEHYGLPHLPFGFLPDGRRISNGHLTGLNEDDVARWRDDPELLDVARAQFVLQVGYADTLLAHVIDRLKEEGIWDDALVVVLSDHGMTFTPGHHRRGFPIEDEMLDEVLPVPLFVKYPGERGGAVDPRPAQTIDVAPTIAEVLGISLPPDWAFDGRPLTVDGGGSRRREYLDSEVDAVRGGERKVLRRQPDAAVMARQLREHLGETDGELDPYRVGPYGRLVHEQADPLVADPLDGAALQLDAESRYDDVELSAVVPAFFGARAEGLGPDDWVAVAVNGTIAGVGPVHDGDGGLRVSAILDPQHLREGDNDVRAYVIRENGRSLQEIVISR